MAAGLESDSVMLSTMLHSASRDAPILVWACTHTKGDRAVPAIEVANMLKLMQLTQPWKVSSISLLTAHQKILMKKSHLYNTYILCIIIMFNTCP